MRFSVVQSTLRLFNQTFFFPGYFFRNPYLTGEFHETRLFSKVKINLRFPHDIEQSDTQDG
jgi:hypothetical protein